MNVEEISQIELTSHGVIYLCLDSGDPSYEYIYRAGGGVYWDAGRKAFLFDTKNDGQAVKWILHMIKAVESEIGLVLKVGEDTRWMGLATEQKDAIRGAAV